MKIISAQTEQQIARCRQLFLEYASSLGFSLCFQNFEKELASLPGEYAPPFGALLLAEVNSKLVGCAGLRKIDDNTCEMKRLYIEPDFRGRGISRLLVKTLIAEALKKRYTKMRLDTINTMKEAISLYRSFGFTESEPYRYNPIEGVLFMELDLEQTNPE